MVNPVTSLADSFPFPASYRAWGGRLIPTAVKDLLRLPAIRALRVLGHPLARVRRLLPHRFRLHRGFLLLSPVVAPLPGGNSTSRTRLLKRLSATPSWFRRIYVIEPVHPHHSGECGGLDPYLRSPSSRRLPVGVRSASSSTFLRWQGHLCAALCSSRFSCCGSPSHGSWAHSYGPHRRSPNSG